ncbi:MAG: glycogen synthase [Myxococcota bacterium]
MDIVLVASEVVPFSKTGGLADVVGALAKTLSSSGHRVLCISPAYASAKLDDGSVLPFDGETRVDVGWKTQKVRWSLREVEGATFAFAHHPLFEREGLYGDHLGPYGDNHLRYAILCKAAIEGARILPVGGAPLGESPLFHVHDWQGSLVPVYLNAIYRPLGLFDRSPTVLTLHNLAHQGWFATEKFADLELPPRWFSDWGLEWYGHGSLLKGGVLQSDMLTTVSPTYAKEILQDGGAHGLEPVLRHRANDLFGIVNGIDTGVWNPTSDPHLPATYTADDLTGKAVCQRALREELGLPQLTGAPLLGTVGRLDPQKGISSLIASIPWLVEEQNAQVVVLGSAAAAHRDFEDELRRLERTYPNHIRAWIGYSERLAHLIEAGADLFVMPSLFEPCGLNQMYSLAYGTPPVVRATGGLTDTVRPHDPNGDAGTGWVFEQPTGAALREALFYAIHTWRHHPEAFRRVQVQGMAEGNAWTHRVAPYLEVYQKAYARRQELAD